MPVLPYHLLRKLFQHPLVGDVSDEMVSWLLVDYTDSCSGFAELVCDTTADALCPTGNDGDLVLELLGWINDKCMKTKVVNSLYGPKENESYWPGIVYIDKYTFCIGKRNLL